MSDMDWHTKVPVECIDCGHEVVTDFDSIRARKTLTCGSCGTSFHIFDVYDMYYEEEPLVKNCIDFILKYVNQPYKIESNDNTSREAVEEFLTKIGFAKLSERMFNDLVKYGDSYLLIRRDHDGKEIVELEPLEPKAMHIVLGEEIRRGIGWTGEREILEFVRKTEQGEDRLKPADVVHIKKREYTRYEPYGESVIRITLKYIHYLRTSGAGARAAGAQWWINYLENWICLGIGVPPILLESNLTKFPKAIVEMASISFIGTINRLHWSTRPLARQVFSEIIKSRNLPEVPRLEWQSLNPTKILRESGFNFMDEMKLWKQLLDLHIITEEEYREAISRYKED